MVGKSTKSYGSVTSLILSKVEAQKKLSHLNSNVLIIACFCLLIGLFLQKQTIPFNAIYPQSNANLTETFLRNYIQP